MGEAIQKLTFFLSKRRSNTTAHIHSMVTMDNRNIFTCFVWYWIYIRCKSMNQNSRFTNVVESVRLLCLVKKKNQHSYTQNTKVIHQFQYQTCTNDSLFYSVWNRNVQCKFIYSIALKQNVKPELFCHLIWYSLKKSMRPMRFYRKMIIFQVFYVSEVAYYGKICKVFVFIVDSFHF